MHKAAGPGILIVGFLTLGSARASQPVTYQTPGKSLAAVCRDLSELEAQTIKPSTDLANEVIAISVSGVTPELLQERIADVTHASWVTESGALVLKQSSSQIRADQTTHEAILTGAFQRTLEAQAKLLSTQPEFDANGASRFADRVVDAISVAGNPEEYAKKIAVLDQGSPSGRAVKRFLGCLRASDLAELPPRIRVVYSNAPNQAQRLLGDAAMAVANDFVREQILWSNEAGAQPAIQSARNTRHYYSLPDFVTDDSAPVGVPAKILVGLYRESENGRIRVDVKMAASSGKIIGQARAILKPQLDPAPIEGLAAQDFQEPLSITEQDLEMGPDGYRRHPLSDQVRRQILDPSRSDPLSIGYGTLLVGIAESEHANLVANLSDQLIDGAVRDGPSFTEAQYLKVLAARGQAAKYSQGWLTLAPQDFFFAHATRANREVLQEYVRGVLLPDFALERQAACALGLPDPMENFMPSELVSTLKGRMIGLQNTALLRFYGSLTDEDVREATRPDGRRLSALTPQAIGYLDEIVNGEMGSLLVSKNVEGIQRDASECLAQGLAPDAILNLRIDASPGVFDLSKDRLPYAFSQGLVTPGELAFNRFARAHPEKYPNEAEEASTADDPHFRTGIYKQYTFQFKLAPYVATNGELEGRSLQGDPMRLEDLPRDFLTQIGVQLAQIEKDEKGGGAVVPPPGTKTPTL